VEALGSLAQYYRRSLGSSVDVIGVTGSNGKTTVREMIYHTLSYKRRGYSSPKNYNNQIGVPITLFGIDSDHDFAVVEMGSNAPGEIAGLSRIAEPDVAVITHVGASHLEGLKDIDGVSAEKVSIVTGLRQRGVVVCGTEHGPTLEKIRTLDKGVITFGLDESCDVYATDVKRIQGGIRFLTNDHCDILLPLLGLHNVRNALAALAVVRRLGMTTAEFARAIAEFRPVDRRMVPQEVNGITIIDDSYNANPVSMKAALEELTSRADAQRRVLVCGDMNELGDHSDKYHRELGRMVAASNIDLLFAVGESAALTARAALEAGMGWSNVQRIVGSKRLARLIKSMIHNGDVILVKGSRAMEMEKVVASLARWKG